ncbi:hypothetical protein [Rhizobium sp. Root482]|uniref:hypothetical protein n=1 Tax=Rhizobium sp. Root482 TaxID=1736543 RepID=UPI0006FEAF22|nr:hypothetical protein [Rhizobium sp. Root482]KQY14419.1 hypothetical protein ASD31_09120 [Rhizobium sp. Root482]
MKIQFSFPRGYEADMTKAREDNDFHAWVDGKFGARIRDLISNDFTMEISETNFIADFVYEDDAIAFLNLFGGRIIG